MHTLRVLHVYDDAEERSAAMNMALDEALFELAAAPSLRFYRWRQPSLSFGYFGRYADVADQQATREIVRRWTGGGVVLHGTDLTYSVILPARDDTKLPPSREIYAAIHDAVRQALTSHVAASLAQRDAPKLSEACFANPVAADVMVGERKIAGAAQRRTRAGLLQQGSIQYDKLPTDFRESFAAAICPASKQKNFAPEMLRHAQ